MPHLSLTHVHNPHPSWYRGDFHAHTHFSDGVLSPPELLATARAAGLDFFAITDHNTVNAYAQFGEQDGLLVIPGMEATFFAGHFNVFGMQADLDWMAYLCGGPLVTTLDPNAGANSDLMASMLSQGLVTSINHPLLRPWAWEMADTDLRNVRCLEIWNDPSWADNARDNPRAVQLWTDLLNAGYRLTAIGGSDFHRPAPPPGEHKPAERLGAPTTYVYAEALSGQAILEGVLRRRAYVSMGAQVSFEAQAGDQTFEIGDDMGTLAEAVELLATVSGSAEPARAQLLRNGAVIAEAPVSGGLASLGCRQLLQPDQPAWFRLDVWGADGLIQAITNPIYAGPVVVPERTAFGEFVDLTPEAK